MKVKNIYITQDKIKGQTDFAQGVYYVLENGDIYEAMSTDVLQHLRKSNVLLQDLTQDTNPKE
jgi:hypothetical protein